MRKLTLHEKITVKGMLARFAPVGLASLNMREALRFHARCTGKSIGQTVQLRKARPASTGLPPYAVSRKGYSL